MVGSGRPWTRAQWAFVALSVGFTAYEVAFRPGVGAGALFDRYRFPPPWLVRALFGDAGPWATFALSVGMAAAAYVAFRALGRVGTG
ncbi:MAG: hypothetical protein ABEJ04_07545 [Halobacteriaceae archaeon]